MVPLFNTAGVLIAAVTVGRNQNIGCIGGCWVLIAGMCQQGCAQVKAGLTIDIGFNGGWIFELDHIHTLLAVGVVTGNQLIDCYLNRYILHGGITAKKIDSPCSVIK